MRLRGLEPPRGCPHGLLKPARLPIPPQPPGASPRDEAPRGRPDDSASAPVSAGARRRKARGAEQALCYPRPGLAPLSSRGLGRRPLTAETGVRIPVAVLV